MKPASKFFAFTLMLSAMIVAAIPYVGAQPRMSEDRARREIDAIYKGDYRRAFRERKPELFLKHIPDDFTSVSVEGNEFDATALRRFFSQRFANQVRLLEHNVTIEDIDVLQDGSISAIVTLYTLEEFKRAKGSGAYLVTTIGTYRDVWQRRSGTWYEVRGDQLRNQTITAPRP
jgi:ketosteroid isomerase-like protein